MYCRSPLAILDPEAVNKALRELSTSEIQRRTIDVDRLADALTMRAPGIGGLNGSGTAAIDAGLAGDLVAAGVAIVAALLN